VTDPARRSRIVIALLVASLALNLFLGGRFAAQLMARRPHGLSAMLPHVVEELGARLSAADRAVLQQVFAAHEADIGRLAATVDDARAGIRAAMAAEPFDGAALHRALDSAEDKDVALRTELENVLVETAERISPGGRRQLAAERPLARR